MVASFEIRFFAETLHMMKMYFTTLSLWIDLLDSYSNYDYVDTNRTGSRRTEFFETATRFGPSRKLLYRFLRHLLPGVTLEPGE